MARFTLLTDKNKAGEIKSKNIEAIKGLISVAYSDGNHLETSWLDVMKCISQLEAAQNSVSGLKNLSNNHIIDGVEEPPSINETNSQSILVAVDRIFTGEWKKWFHEIFAHGVEKDRERKNIIFTLRQILVSEMDIISHTVEIYFMNYLSLRFYVKSI